MLATRSTRSTRSNRRLGKILLGMLVATTSLSALLLLTGCDNDGNDRTSVPQVTSITLIAPVGGEIWGAVRTISWQVTLVTTETVDVLLSSDSGLNYIDPLATGVHADSMYTWDTNVHPDGTTYRVQVNLVDGTGAVVASDATAQDFALDNTGELFGVR